MLDVFGFDTSKPMVHFMGRDYPEDQFPFWYSEKSKHLKSDYRWFIILNEEDKLVALFVPSDEVEWVPPDEEVMKQWIEGRD